MDTDFCLTCGKPTEDGNPYCSSECQYAEYQYGAGPSKYRPHSTVPLSETPYYLDEEEEEFSDDEEFFSDDDSAYNEELPGDETVTSLRLTTPISTYEDSVDNASRSAAVEGPDSCIPFTLGSREMAGYIATMSPERQEAFEVEMAQWQARIELQSERDAVEAETRVKASLERSAGPQDQQVYKNTRPPLSPNLTIVGSDWSELTLTPLPGLENSVSTEWLNTSKARIAVRGKRGERKKYECSVCHDRFTSRQNLENHMNAHSGILPFVCPECNKKYRHPVSLKRHRRSAHGVIPPLKRSTGKAMAVDP